MKKTTGSYIIATIMVLGSLHVNDRGCLSRPKMDIRICI